MGGVRNHARNDFLDRLASYAAETAACLNRKPVSAPRWWLFSAAAGATVANALTADAAVIYSGERNLTVGPVQGSHASDHALIDVDLDGRPDLNLTVEAIGSVFANFADSSSFRLRSRGHRTRAAARVEGLGQASVFTTSDQGHLRQFAGGLIGSSMASQLASAAAARLGTLSIFTSYNSAGDQTATGTRLVHSGKFSSGLSFLAGFRFGTTNGEHFGWIRLLVEDADENGILDQFTAVSWAYESTPNQPFELGNTIQSVPEPGTLALATLATGWAGLAALRRRRNPPGSVAEKT